MWGGGRVPHLRSGQGGYPIPGPDGGGIPHPRSRWGVPYLRSRRGYSIPGLDGGYPILLTGVGVPHLRSEQGVPQGTPHMQDWMGYPPSAEWGTPPHPRMDGVNPIQDWMEYPLPIQDWMEYPLPIQGWMGYPPSKTEWGTPSHQQSEHLLSGRRCASCVHAGGLFCFVSRSHRPNLFAPKSLTGN